MDLKSQSEYGETTEIKGGTETSDRKISSGKYHVWLQSHVSIGHVNLCADRPQELQQNTAMCFSQWERWKPLVNTVTQLKTHSCHLQTIQLYAKYCVFFTLSTEALVLEYSRIPPWRPPTTRTLPSLRCQMLHGRVVRLGHPGKACTNPCLQTIACLSWILPSPKEQILLDNQSHPRKQLEP